MNWQMLIEDAEDENEDFIPDLDKINNSGKHLLGLINDILDLSKVESGKMELFIEEFDLKKIIEEVETTIKPLVEKMITIGKKGSLHARRQLISKLPKDAKINKLFNEFPVRYKNRAGGYIRILKKGFRYGDAAPLAVVELVDRDENARVQDVPVKSEDKKDNNIDKNIETSSPK